MMKRCVAMCLGLAVLSSACSRQAPETAAPPAHETTAASADSSPETPVDACALLTSDEIQAIIGGAVQNTKAERQIEGGLVISQCHFALPELTDAVTLRVVQRGNDESARDPRQVWQETFTRDLERAVRERKKAPPERVPDLGDEAFWLGGPKRGALYVLKGNRYLRLNLGGEPNQAEKIEKTSQLARLILERW